MLVGVEEESDEDLVGRVRAGDDLAFATLARRHRAWLVGACTALLRDRDLAEDVAQESLVKAYRLIAAGTPPARLRPWLRVVARHACIDERRRRRPELVDVVPDYASAHRDADADGMDPEHLVPDELDVSLATAWKRIDPRHRDVLRRRELQGLTYAEIAATMGLSLAAVETLLFRARAALRREYGRAGGTALPTESLARGLLLVDAGKVDGAAPLTTALSHQAAHLLAQAAPAVANGAPSGGGLGGLRELAASLAATALTLGLVVPPMAGDPLAVDRRAAPPVEVVAVPDIQQADTEARPPAPPEPELPDREVHPPAPDAGDAPATAPEPPDASPSDAEAEGGRLRQIANHTQERVGAVTERVIARPREVTDKIFD